MRPLRRERGPGQAREPELRDCHLPEGGRLGVDFAKFNDAYFKKPAKDRSKKSEADFFAEEAAKKELPASYLEDNKALDAALGPVIQKVPHLAGYMATKFTLRSGDKPHEMKF